MDTPCNVVVQYNSNTPLHVAQGMQIVFSAISILVVLYTALRFLVTSIFEQVFKELLFFLYFLIFAHSVILMTLQGILVIVRLTATDPCQAQISKRIVSTLTANEKMQVVARRIMIGLSIIYPITITFLAYRNESFEGRVPYCNGSSYSSGQISQFNLFVLFVLNVLDLVLDVALLKYNQCKLKFDKSFHMLVTFRRRQIVYSIKEFLPSAIFHCLCYIAQLFMVFYGRSLRGNMSEMELVAVNAFAYVISFYCAFGPIILFILMTKGRLIRKENLKNAIVPLSDDDARSFYFTSLQQQWKMAETQG